MSCKKSTPLTFQKCSYDISTFHYSFQQQDLLRRRWTNKPLWRTRLALSAAVLMEHQVHRFLGVKKEESP